MREEILKIGKLPIPEKIEILKEIKSKLKVSGDTFRTEFICLIMDDVIGSFIDGHKRNYNIYAHDQHSATHKFVVSTSNVERKYLLGRFGLLNGLKYCDGCWSPNEVAFLPIADRDRYTDEDMVNWKKTIVQFAIDLLNMKNYTNNHFSLSNCLM